MRTAETLYETEINAQSTEEEVLGKFKDYLVEYKDLGRGPQYEALYDIGKELVLRRKLEQAEEEGGSDTTIRKRLEEVIAREDSNASSSNLYTTSRRIILRNREVAISTIAATTSRKPEIVRRKIDDLIIEITEPLQPYSLDKIK